MSLHTILDNLVSPAVLFFIAGQLAVLVGSDLELPKGISKFLSQFLLFAIGLKGGHELATGHFSQEIVVTLILAILSALLTPIVSFIYLRRKFSVANAAAIAATYGSVSAVTFVTAVAFLQQNNQAFGGHMVAALALMESPAIIVGVVLFRKTSPDATGGSLKSVVVEAFTNGSVFLLLVSMVIGFAINEHHYGEISPLTEGMFKGALTLFLLDMGLLAGKRIGAFKKDGLSAILFSTLAPCFQAALMMAVARLAGVELGNALLLTVLAASASYIAVPAAMRLVIPKANPGLFVPMAIGITFPFNVTIGIPVYFMILQMLYR